MADLLRTRSFDLWGTESREEWHVFGHGKGDEKTGEPPWMAAQVCIHTPSIKHTDVFTIVLSKDKHPPDSLTSQIDALTMAKVGFPLKYVNNDVCSENPRYERKR